MTAPVLFSPRGLLAPLLPVLALVAGCGGPRQYSVVGVVQFDDGTPVGSNVQVVFTPADAPSAPSAVGFTDPQGRFELFTFKRGDGVAPGRYRAAVSQMSYELGGQPAVPEKFADPEKSGLEFVVKPERNDFTVTVARPKKSPPK